VRTRFFKPRSKNYFIASLVPLFPTFALIAHAIVGSERGETAHHGPVRPDPPGVGA
jgi:uncharacterized membrane protein (GlpM family)